MAEQFNEQAQRMADLMERINREMATTGELGKRTADDVFDARVREATGIRNATKSLDHLADAVGSAASGALSYANAMATGQKGAAAANSALDGVASAAKSAGLMLSSMIPGGPIIKLFIAGITAAVGATAEYAKRANEMADTLRKGYSGLAKSGAVASEGMTGVFKGAKKLGLSMNELDGYIQLVGKSSQDLAMFAGSAFEGRRQFEDMGSAMEPFKQSLLNAGMSQEDINEGAMSYLRLQTRIGMAQNMTTQQLAEGAKKYLVEMDGLSKLTGQSRKQMEDQMEAARSEQRFRAKLEAMRAAGQTAQADELEKANLLITSRSKEAGQAFRDLSTGMITTEAAQKGMIGSQGQLLLQSQRIINSQVDAAEGATIALQAQGDFAKKMNATAQMGVLDEFSLNYVESIGVTKYAAQDFSKSLSELKAEQEKQGATGKKAADDVTQSYTELILAQQKANKTLEEFVAAGMLPAIEASKFLATTTTDAATGLTAAFEKLAEIVKDLGVAFDKIMGTLAKIVAADTPEQKQKIAAEAGVGEAVGGVATGAAGAYAGGTFGAALGTAIFPVVGTAIGAALGAALGGAGGYFAGSGLGAMADKDILNNAGKPIERRRSGGPVVGKTPYLVGEAGPELFVPSMAGDIVPTNKITGTTGSALEYSSSVERAAKEILKDTERLEKLTDLDTERAKKYSIFYNNYLDKKTQFMQDELDDINTAVELKETSGVPGGGIMSSITGLLSKMGFGGAAPEEAPTTRSMKPGRVNMGGQGVVKNQSDLSKMGLKIKAGDVQAEGSLINPKLLEMAAQVQSNLPNFAYFSGFNDKYHQESSPSSLHTKGLAMDFALSKPPTKDEGQEIVRYLKSLGASFAIDEYNNPSSKATAGHIHAQIAGYADGGIAKTPQIAMVAEKGPEAMIPLGPDGNLRLDMPDVKAMFDNMAQAFKDKDSTAVSPTNSNNLVFEEMVNIMRENYSMMQSMIDQMIREQKNSNSIQERILQTSM